MTRKPQAVLWDMDGTIIDTEPFWLQAESGLARQYGVEWSLDEALQNVGNGLTVVGKQLQDKGVPLSVDDIVAELNRRVLTLLGSEEPWRPGALELLKDLKDQGIPMALVTMSYTDMAVKIAEMTGLTPFQAIITGDTVDNPKPHPEPYLKAAAELGVEITECIAFEDSVNGANSAAASGALTAVIPNHVAIPEHGGYRIIDTLAGLTVADLGDWLNERDEAR